MTPLILLLAVAGAAPVEGQVLERGTGDPLPEVEVRAGDVTTTTDDAGRFALDLEPGARILTLTGWDHAPTTVDVTVPADAPLKIWLSEADAEHVIVVEAFRLTPHVSRHVVDAEMAHETPGTLDDSVRLVQSLPGVTVQREYSPGQGALSVRGSGPGDNRVLFDGIEIPYLYHFNQYASVVPTSALSSLELYSSAPGAAYGDAVGAIVEASSRDDAPAVLHGSAHLNFIMGGGSVRAPVGGDWWVSASGRRSYQDLVGEGSAQYTLWPRFHDYSVRADNGPWTIHLWGAGDAYDRAAGELDLLDPAEASLVPTFSYKRAFEVLSVQRRWDDGRLVAAVVHDRLQGALTGGGAEDLRTVWLQGRLDDRVDVGDNTWVTWGAELRGELADLSVEGATAAAIVVADEAPALARGVDVDLSASRLRTGLYGELHVRQGNLRVFPGLRLASDTRGAPLLPEPRLALRWRVAEQTELKLGGGRYHQAADTEHLLPHTGDPGLPTTAAWQVAGGVEQTIAQRIELVVEGYGKRIERPHTFPVDGPALAGDVGSAWGVEVVGRYRLRETFFLWTWAAVSRSFVDGRPADGDQPFSAGVVTSWDLGRGWNLGVRYRHGSGLPWTPISDSVYDATRDGWIPIADAENSARMPPYHKLDLHAAHTWTFDRWTLTASAEVWIVPAVSAQLYPAWSHDWREQGWVRGPTALPLLTAHARF